MIAVLALFLACGARPPSSDPPAAPEPAALPATPPANPEATPTPTLLGSWRSEACGERTYPRELKLVDDGTWAALDLVAPCPEGAMCAWSGVVPSHGTWIAEGGGVRLVPDGPPQGPATPMPDRLDPTTDGAVATESGAPCAYARQPNAPQPEEPR